MMPGMNTNIVQFNLLVWLQEPEALRDANTELRAEKDAPLSLC